MLAIRHLESVIRDRVTPTLMKEGFTDESRARDMVLRAIRSLEYQLTGAGDNSPFDVEQFRRGGCNYKLLNGYIYIVGDELHLGITADRDTNDLWDTSPTVAAAKQQVYDAISKLERFLDLQEELLSIARNLEEWCNGS